MYGWEGRSFDDIARLCGKRDPRRFPVGALTAAQDRDPAVLQWFRDGVELSAFLWRMEPQRWGIRLGELAALKESTRPLYTLLDVFGPSEELRMHLNRHTLPRYQIVWWGNWTELVAAHGDWPERTIAEFRAGPAGDVQADEIERLIGFLRERYLPPS